LCSYALPDYYFIYNEYTILDEMQP